MLDYDGDDWREFAACRDSDPELFFPVGLNVRSRVQASQAKSICYRCPVRTECYEFSISVRPRMANGIFGGVWFDEGEHMRIERNAKRKRQRVAHDNFAADNDDDEGL